MLSPVVVDLRHNSASMLREHGAHRPSVFEVLETVHKMRGTKSRFTYVRVIKQIRQVYSDVNYRLSLSSNLFHQEVYNRQL